MTYVCRLEATTITKLVRGIKKECRGKRNVHFCSAIFRLFKYTKMNYFVVNLLNKIPRVGVTQSVY
jgi:hypothetical protein